MLLVLLNRMFLSLRILGRRFFSCLRRIRRIYAELTEELTLSFAP